MDLCSILFGHLSHPVVLETSGTANSFSAPPLMDSSTVADYKVLYSNHHPYSDVEENLLCYFQARLQAVEERLKATQEALR